MSDVHMGAVEGWQLIAIIEREGICLLKMFQPNERGNLWVAYYRDGEFADGENFEGPTALIAAMRCATWQQ